MRKSLIFAVAALLTTHSPALATSIVCPDDPASAYERADAVVLARVVSIKKSAPKPPMHAIVQIDVRKYWKLKDKEIPRIMAAGVNEFEINRGLYLLFLKKYDAENYQQEMCSPLMRLNGQAGDIEKVLFLNTKEAHDVDQSSK